MVRPEAKSEPTGPQIVPKRRKAWGLLLAAGPILLFAAAVSYGVAERHSSTDTWIALATGRYILTEWQVPLVDPFSYTFAGQPWFNQNWLSHVFFYWLYDRISPSVVILGTWVMNGLMFVLVLAAIRVRSRSWLASWIGASFVALGGYAYLSARPASVGFLLLASLMAILSALAAPALRRHWWPALLLLPLFGIWGCAHGTFFFGYGLVALFVGCWFVTWIMRFAAARVMIRWAAAIVTVIAAVAGLLITFEYGLEVALNALRQYGLKGAFIACGLLLWVLKPFPNPLALRQVVVVAVAAVLAAVLTMALGPYGFENFTHPLKVVESDVFRTVNEWKPPYQYAKYPPVWAFWASLGVALFSLAVAFVTWLLALALRETGKARRGRKRLEPDAPCISLFDVVVVLLGLYMALWARRFAPLFYILAAPTIVTAVVLLTARASDMMRRRWRVGLLAASWAGALLVGAVSARKAHADFVAPYANRPEMDLLERSVRYERVPQPAIEFLSRNDLRVNLMTEWTVAGVVMVQAPRVKVFIDGRSQQVYDETHYLRYMTLLSQDARAQELALKILDRSGTDAVLLRSGRTTVRLIQTLAESNDWTVVLDAPGRVWALFLRPSSPAFEQLARLDSAGQAWWPSFPQAEIFHANLALLVDPPDYDRALQHYRAAVDQQPAFGLTYYVDMARLWIRQNRAREGNTYFQRQANRFRTPVKGDSEGVRRALSGQIDRCRQMLREAESPPPG